MSVYKRGGKWWVQYYEKVDGLLKKFCVGGWEKKSEAQAEDAKIKSLKKEGKSVLEKRKSFIHTFDDLLNEYKTQFTGQRYFKSKSFMIKVFEKFFSGKKLSEIGIKDIERFRNERKNTPVRSGDAMVTREGCKLRMQLKRYKPPKERAVASVNRELSVLRHMMSKAVEWEMLERSPFTGAKGLFYRENNQRKRFLSDDEETRLLNQCNGYLKRVVLFALNTGMRRGEILGLKWEQIRNDLIYVTQSKTDKAREIPINGKVRSVLDGIPRFIGRPYVFHRKTTGEAYADLKMSFNAACKRAGLVDFHFHDLRHTFASKLVMRGAGLKVVQELLGHSNILMTMRYSHLADAAKVKSVMLLDEPQKEFSYNLATTNEKSTYVNSVSA